MGVAHDEMTETLELNEKMAKFDAENTCHPLFKAMQQYMQMVMEMAVFAIKFGQVVSKL